MPPAPKMEEEFGPIHVQVPLLEMASAELEKMRGQHCDAPKFQSFPPACLTLLKSTKGNHQCVDCGEHDPQWATVSYGGLLCLQCSGRHRSLGVQVSCVRSITMDNWTHAEVLAMLEGGNAQLGKFFSRHKLCSKDVVGRDGMLTSENVLWMRYKTKAALFYKEQMAVHVSKVAGLGIYKGREHSRRLSHRRLTERNSAMV
mmetsp:Transcript_4847/g.10902  ORF Transcript_4847/g.10902 Transcript_4847/m.10902 type:complete len:201 (+) Transcript_4847:251-853(+)|eukprot:CAMPEP_0116832528 /NCGR_PEP_ID=MMETSP0418-20121206/5942_1 /TAXON_ID=1158023 /ORGANISM="Astrosyne radiata, Strain 13vi08-1A" /LENGTH=200 /DNA_ID=CAMNT_0004461899 /DNA_START=230 /DNA_END=832 /DNA_ORIENTATION=+